MSTENAPGMRGRASPKETHTPDRSGPAIVLILTLLLAACGETPPPPTPVPLPSPAARLSVAVVPAAQVRLSQWAARYEEDHPGVTVEAHLESPGQIQGALARGQVDLALIDREPTATYPVSLTATWVAEEPIAVLVHRHNPLHDLSAATIGELLSGRVSDWSQVGGAAGPVRVYLRPDTEGETAAWPSLAGRRLAPQAIVCPSAASLLRAVAQDAGSIGLLPVNLVQGDVAILRVDGTLPGEEGYPWHVPLFLAYGPAAPPQAEDFVRFVRWVEDRE